MTKLDTQYRLANAEAHRAIRESMKRRQQVQFCKQDVEEEDSVVFTLLAFFITFAVFFVMGAMI